MLCPTCNQEIGFTGICTRCSGPQNASNAPQAAGDPFAGPTAQLPAPKRGQPILVIFGFVMWIGVVFFAFLEARLMGQSRHRDIQGFFIGALIVPVSVAAVVTWLINRARKSKLSPAQKHFWAAGIALTLSLMGFSGASQERPTFRQTDPKKETARLLAEASGKSPVSPDTDWWDNLMRDFFRSVIDRNKRYSQEIREFDNSALHRLYSPDSYSARAGMQKTIAQLQGTLQVDQKYGTMRPILQDMEKKLQTVDASESEKESFLEGLKSTSEVFLGSQDKLVALEEKWIESSIALYQFAIDHRADYAIKGSKLLFKSDTARLEFVAKQGEAIAQRRAFLDEKAALDRVRNNMMTEIGLASNDTGEAPSSAPEK